MISNEFDFVSIVKNFKIDGEVVFCERYGCGHINDTFDLHMSDGKRFIIQRINNKIFTNVEGLMSNISLVTNFQKQGIIQRGGDPSRECLNLVETVDGKSYYFDGKNYYRIYLFIDNATSYQIVEKPQHFFEAGAAFGNFQSLLSKFDANKIYEVIKDFHNTQKRFEHFIESLNADKENRAKSIKKEINFVIKHENDTKQIVNLIASGDIPLKVTHNDTKLNNVMIDDETGKGICVIDLDTIMPGTVLYDFGDSIRFGTNPVAEDEQDISKVIMSMPLFEEFTKGYLGAVKHSLNKCEIENLAFSSLLMTLECGIRFLDDYLSGDTYFRTHRPGHNLDRARTQFKLVSDMEDNMSQMNKIVKKYSK